MTKFGTLAIGFLMLAPAAASANVIEDRRTEQAGMIERGRENGSITWLEGLKLRKEQREVARVENELSADGRLSHQDRKYLHNLQNKAEDDIASKSSNGWSRPSWLPRVGR